MRRFVALSVTFLLLILGTIILSPPTGATPAANKTVHLPLIIGDEDR